jgi:hypothetical protein
MDKYLQENFELPAKNPSEEAQRRWRSAVGTLVKNRRRRFRHVPDLDQRQQDNVKRRSVQVNAITYTNTIHPSISSISSTGISSVVLLRSKSRSPSVVFSKVSPITDRLPPRIRASSFRDAR